MSEKGKVTSVGEWIVMLLVTTLPFVGIIMLFIWGFGGEQGTSKSNFAKAALIVYVILIAVGAIFGSAFIAYMLGMETDI